MTTFGLITEGITDQIVIENILSGYFQSDNLSVHPLQPERNKDNDNESGDGGWTLVFPYCKSEDFKQAFQFNDYMIIQIDTDVLDGYEGISYRDKNGELTPEQLIEKVKEKFKSLIGEAFYSEHSHRIIFAIAVHSTECWLLPLYYTDNRKKKITGCLGTLNRAINTREPFTIDAKKSEYYERVSKAYRKNQTKRKTLMEYYRNNPSLNSFIQEIETRKIVIKSED